MKTQPFNAYIKTIRYTRRKNFSRYEPFKYLIDCELEEVKKGKPQYHLANLYISEEQYNNKTFGKLDRVAISNRANWTSQFVALKTYDKERLKKINPTRLKKDAQGRTYADITFYAYRLIAKEGEWSLEAKADDYCFIQVCRGVRCYIMESQINDDSFCWFFDKDIYDRLVDKNFYIMEMNCYLRNKQKWKKRIELQTGYDETSEHYFANLIVKGVNNAE